MGKKLLWVAILVALLDPYAVAANEAVHVNMERATIRPGERNAATKKIDVVASIENVSDVSVNYVLIAINAFSDEEEIRVNPIPSTASELFYAENLGRFELVRLPNGLQPGKAIKKTITLDLPRSVAGTISAFSVTSAGGGGDEFAEQLLASPLVSPQTRSALASELSMRNRKQYSYLTDQGTWAAPPGFDNLPPAPRTRSQNTVRFERERIAGTNAEVSISNAASKDITVNLMGGGASQKIVIPPGGSRSLTLNPGLYSFTATSRGVRPLSDVKSFDAGYEYTWRFWITTSYR